MDTKDILLTLESIKKACGALCRQEHRRTLLSKDTRLFLESVFEKKRSPNSRERMQTRELSDHLKTTSYLFRKIFIVMLHLLSHP
ncbi:LAFA_0G00210g1_1 [Lachancea sp. 'fantastica']|nr:LAFA_0G00210g1_1 [Lachancea sp. 'fantastica']